MVYLKREKTNSLFETSDKTWSAIKNLQCDVHERYGCSVRDVFSDTEHQFLIGKDCLKFVSLTSDEVSRVYLDNKSARNV